MTEHKNLGSSQNTPETLDQFSTKKVTNYRVFPPTLPSAKVACLFNRLLAWHLTTAFGPIFTDLGFTPSKRIFFKRNKVRTDSLKTFLKPSLIRTIVACWEILLSKAFKKGAAKSQHSAVSFAAKCRLVRRWCAVRSRLSLKMMEIWLSKV